MDEPVPEPRLPDLVPGGPIDVTPGDAGSDGIHAGPLGSPDRLVDLAEPGLRLAERHRPGHVRVVALHQRAQVHRHQVPWCERPVGGPVVGLGAVRPERHDRVEGHPVRPGAAHRRLQLDGHLPFGHALAELGHDRLERLVRGVLGHLYQPDLLGVLGLAQRLDHPADRHQLHAGVGQVGPRLVREVLGLEGHPGGADPSDGLGHRRCRRARVRDAIEVGDLPARLVGVPAVGQEHPRPDADHQVAVRSREPAEVPDARQVTRAERVDAEVVEPLEQSGTASGVVHVRR